MMLVGVFHVSRDLSTIYFPRIQIWLAQSLNLLPRERFKTILRFYDLTMYDIRITRISVDRLAPTREVLEYINGALQNSYSPNRFLTVDEHMCGYRGRCLFRKYMPKSQILMESKYTFWLTREISIQFVFSVLW